jgi:mono/diheme cytochrome c family protein
MNPSAWVFTILSVAISGSAGRPAAVQDEGSKAPGLAAYDRVCHTCHGPEGRGDAAPRLVPFDRSIEELQAVVRDGRGQMPPISEKRLTNEELVQIVEYLKSLSKPQ